MSTRRWHEIANPIRKNKGLTYGVIADSLGVNKSTVGHWFTGRTVPRLSTIRRLAKMLDTSVTELIEEDPYFVTDQEERAFLDRLREVPKENRAQAEKLLAAFLESISCPD